MSALQLMDPPSDDLNKTETVNNGIDKITNPILPSSIDPASQCTPTKVPFAYNASLKQVSAITPGMAMQYDSEEDEEDNIINFIGTMKKGGTYRTTAGSTSVNDHQAKENPNLLNLGSTTAYDAFIPKVTPTSPFAKVCFEVGSGCNLVVAAQMSTQILERPYGMGVNMSQKIASKCLGINRHHFFVWWSCIPETKSCYCMGHIDLQFHLDNSISIKEKQWLSE